MVYEYKELKDANGTTFKAAVVEVDTDVFASLFRLDLEKAEDAAHFDGDHGLMILAVRKDTAAALAGTDGDYIPLIVDANGRLHVLDPNSATVAALSKAEDAVHASGDTGIQLLAVRKDTAAALAGTSGDYAPLEVDANGRLHVLDANSATIAALSKAEDAAHTTGDTGIQILAVRKDTAEALAGTAGDYAPLEVDALGRLHVSCHMPEALDSINDSINVNKMGKALPITAHDAISATATSEEISCVGYNAVLVYVTFSDTYNWTFKVQGCLTTGGTFVDWYELANTGSMAAMIYQCNASRGFVFKGIPDYIKIVATEDQDGATVTVKVQPLNI